MERSASNSTTIFGSVASVFCCTLLLWLVSVLWGRRRLYLYSAKIPGPLGFPLIGSLYKFLGNPHDILSKLEEIQLHYPGLSKVWFGPKLVFVVKQPEHIGKVLNNPLCLNKDDIYQFLSKGLGYGLLTAPVEKWRPHRKIINPSFNIKILESFVEIFARQTGVLSKRLEEHVGKTEIDLLRVFSMYTMDTICETTMGVKLNAQNGDCAFATNLDKVMEITFLRIFRIWYHSDLLWNFMPLRREYDRALLFCKTFSTKVIRTRIDAYKKKIEDRRSGLIANTEESKRIKASLDLMLENSGFTEEELREEVEILIVAATDTSGALLTFLLICLGMYQDVQERVYKEVINTIGHDREILASDLPQMNYLEMVIKETLRLFPVAPYFLRKLDGDIDLGDAILPKGATIYLSLLSIHRDPRYWSEPLKFDPDRFLPENGAKRHPFAYIPFSAGPRNCIGSRYALMNIKTVIATILRKYRVFSDYKSLEEIKLKIHVLLRTVDIPKVRLEYRH